MRNVLKIEDLIEPASKALERSEIPLEAGYQLARNPENDQLRFLELALTMPTKNFKEAAISYRKELLEAYMTGRGERAREVKKQPKAYARSVKDIKAELKEKKEVQHNCLCNATRSFLRWIKVDHTY